MSKKYPKIKTTLKTLGNSIEGDKLKDYKDSYIEATSKLTELKRIADELKRIVPGIKNDDIGK